MYGKFKWLGFEPKNHNLSEILSVNYKIIHDSTLTYFDKNQTWVPDEGWLYVQTRKKQKTDDFLQHSSSTFFELSSSLLLKYGPWGWS